MFTWLKEKLWNPIKGFFKGMFWFAELEERYVESEKAYNRIGKILRGVRDERDNLKKENEELILRFNKQAGELKELRAEKECRYFGKETTNRIRDDWRNLLHENIKLKDTIICLQKENERLKKESVELESVKNNFTEHVGLALDYFIETRITPQLAQLRGDFSNLRDDYSRLRQRHLETTRENTALRFEVDTYRNGRFAAPGA